MAQLRTEWGADYDARVGQANRALQEFGGDALVDLLASPSSIPLGDHPLVIKAFAQIAENLIEHGALPATGVESMTPDDAQAKIAEKNEELKRVPEGGARAAQLVDEIIALTARAARR